MLLEPIMKVEVVVPEEYMAPVFGDLNARRSAIQGTENRAGSNVIRVRSAVGANVWLRDGFAQPHAGSRDVHHALLALCRDAAERLRKK